MKNKTAMAGLVASLLFTGSQMAMAADYYAFLEPRTAIPDRYERSTAIQTTALAYPVLVEAVVTSSAVVLEPSRIPVMLDRTTTVRPPRFLEFRAGKY